MEQDLDILWDTLVVIGGSYNSCLGERTWEFATDYGGNIPLIQDSCLVDTACLNAAVTIGNIGSISFTKAMLLWFGVWLKYWGYLGLLSWKECV